MGVGHAGSLSELVDRKRWWLVEGKLSLDLLFALTIFPGHPVPEVFRLR